jgi:ribose 5-phosphate isomerase B
MKVYLGTDHNGFRLKQEIRAYLERLGHEVVDEGDEQLTPDDDFPQFAGKVVSALLADKNPDSRGILLCGSGQGMCMAANRFNGIRAALVWDTESAHASRNDDDSNILCLPARVLKSKDALNLVNLWLKTPFSGAPRFSRRIKELDQLT